MTFSERLKGIREKKELTQEQLAKRSGISRRMIQKYESGIARPRFDAAEKIASALEITVSELLGESGSLVAQAAEKYGSRGAKQAEELMSEVTGLFAGGEMAEEDMDVMMKAITEAYWIAKEKNKKFTPNKYKSQG
ncbi:MAG TPA: Cro/Cl family transcriptional regulator [Lactococcus sp.]|nr:Cro/Cl family transcriptional regulator [Lactococcus sp.]